MKLIAFQSLLKYWHGEEDELTALSRAIGMHISNVWAYPKDFVRWSEIKSEIKETD